ncbi:PHP domain-containing protein [Tenggerimyces flavus]|uniref:Histidinol-phosphatase n=1 Tax=Tenggerimyces flavus TaxID=1708749 RepID=A0ABV7YIC0_9ACTN|nr:PHP domain-containing protein [Tenggerimyces flavus]
MHSEWSWDARRGSMERTCTRAVELGLPAVAFTEHADHTRLTIPEGSFFEQAHGHLVAEDRTLQAPPLDLTGYLESVQRCRDKYPDLKILSGVELGEAHWHADAVATLLEAGQFDRVLGSQHCLQVGSQRYEIPDLYLLMPPAEIMHAYLAEVHRLIESSDVFAVLGHIDYAVRGWVVNVGPFDPWAFEDEFRHVLRALAGSGRALEVNTRVPLHPEIVRWWRQEGGDAITFASDAHEPMALANGFAEAVAMVESIGFRPGRHPYDLWRRG